MGLPVANVNDKLLISFRGTVYGQRIINTFAYNLSGVAPFTSWTDLITSLNTALIGAGRLRQKFLACSITSYTLDTIRYQVLFPTRYVAVDFPQVAQIGTLGSDAFTANTAVTITRRGQTANRQNISSLHIVGANDSALADQGVLKAAYKTPLGVLGLELLTAYLLDAGATQLDPIIFHRTSPSLVTGITQTLTQDTLRVMRRRTVRVGE